MRLIGKIFIVLIVLILVIHFVDLFVDILVDFVDPNQREVNKYTNNLFAARYFGIKFAEKKDYIPGEIDEDGYYILVLIYNKSNFEINSDFEFGVDIKYKDEYIIKNGVCRYIVAEKRPLYIGSKSVMLVKTTEDVFNKYQHLNNDIGEVSLKINYLKYKEKIEYNGNWEKGYDW